MEKKKILYFITGNPHKYHEIKSMIEESFSDYSVVQKELPLKEIQANTLEEVAKFKVKSVRSILEPPYFIEDAGFFVDDVCHGFPGVYSSYVMKTIGYDGILKIMKGESERKAHFESVIAYMDKDDKVFLFRGKNKGKVSEEPKGTSGFGFDPIFLSEDFPQKTFAELTTAEKNRVSHRTRSMKKFLKYLSDDLE